MVELALWIPIQPDVLSARQRGDDGRVSPGFWWKIWVARRFCGLLDGGLRLMKLELDATYRLASVFALNRARRRAFRIKSLPRKARCRAAAVLAAQRDGLGRDPELDNMGASEAASDGAPISPSDTHLW